MKKNAQDRYKTIIRLAPGIVYTVSRDGVITSLNRAFERITGWKRSEWLGKHFAPLVHPYDLPLAAWTLEEALKGKIIDSFELRILSKKGNFLNLEFSSGPDIVDGQIIGKIGIARDITRQKRQAEANARRDIFDRHLNKAAAVLSSSLDYDKTLKKLAKILVPGLADWSSVHIVNGQGELENLTVAHIDPKKMKWALSLQAKYKYALKDPENVTVRVVNSGKAEFYPYITEEMIKLAAKNKNELKLLRKLELKSIIVAPLSAGRKPLGAVTLVSTNVQKLYDEVDLKFAEELGKLAGQAIENARLYLEAQSEIKKRMKIEEQLRESRDHLNIILANVADGITVLDDKARVVYVNKAVAVASGYSSYQEMLDAPLKWKRDLKVFDESGNAVSTRDLPGRMAVRIGQEVAKTVKYTNKDTGTEKWSTVRAKPIFSKDGKVSGSVSITHDITEAKELERRRTIL